MKKILLSVSLLATSLVASAQLAITSADNWSGVRLSYAPTTMKYDKNLGIDNVNLNGFAIEYFKGISVVPNLPLLLEVGAGFEWLTHSNTESESILGVEVKAKESFNAFTVNVPINVGYKFSLNENVALVPYIGLKARVGLSATNKLTVKASYDGESEKESESFNQFSEDDMGKNTMKRFLLGWQIGATASYNQYIFGVNYGTCFTNEVYNNIDSRLGAVTISAGYTF
jgi:hypothetical protein